jgi:alpha-L-rhamnosidase
MLANTTKKIKKAFCEEFVSKRGRIDSNTQTAYVLALMFDLLPEGDRPKAAKRLVDDIRKRGNHLSTGFVGTPYLCHVLSRNGYLDVAYDLLNQETFPSWLYPVKLGATTIWERWDGIKPDGSFQDASMNSFNHYAYGAIGHWLYSVVGGLDVDPDEPGYKHILIGPQPGGGLTYARTSMDSIYGKITSDWKLTEKGLRLRVAVPPNTRATVRIPASSVDHVTESGRPLSSAEGVENAHQDGRWVVVEIGSGDFTFETDRVS